jgi:hypothetical protein
LNRKDRDELMTTSGRGQVWTGAQLTARLITLRGLMPAVTQHAVYRTTTGVGASTVEGYLVPGETRRLTPSALDFWLAKRGLAGVERLSVSVLVIRENLGPDGDLRECELEYRRGALDGPYHGNPARITFSGPARMTHFYQATPDGTLTEIAPPSDPPPSNPPAPDPPTSGAPAPAETDTTAAMHRAVRACCGAAARIVETRQPTVLEAMVGIAGVLHVVLANGREVGCGIIWHGPIAVALQADFPRFDVAPVLSAQQTAALDALLRAEHLIACETRRDEHGLAVVTRRRGTTDLLLVRFDGDTAALVPPAPVPYVPGHPADLTADQAQWLHYVETYEGLGVLDAYRDGASDTLIVLTGGTDGAVWRHHVDSDGIETWRRPDAGSAAGMLYREKTSGDVARAGHLAAAPMTGEPDPLAAPFGAKVEAQFPSASYDIDEAARCLVLRRPTAVAFHCLRILDLGLRGHALWRGATNPPAQTGQRWRSVIGELRRGGGDSDLLAALDGVRRAWRGAALLVGPKYTEEEAAGILRQVEAFMRCLAELCDEAGEPAGHDDDG